MFQDDKVVYTMTKPEADLQLTLQALCWFLEGVALSKKIEKVVAQYHFGITAMTQVALPPLQPDAVKTMADSFLDTREHDLVKRKLWLKKRVSKDAKVTYSLKLEEQSESSNILLYREVTNPADIMALITSKTTLVAVLENGNDICSAFPTLVSFADLEIRRHEFIKSPIFRVYVDSVQFAKNTFYLVGTISVKLTSQNFTAFWKENRAIPKSIMSDLGIERVPVRSVILAYLNYKEDPIISNAELASIDYCDTFAKAHFHENNPKFATYQEVAAVLIHAEQNSERVQKQFLAQQSAVTKETL